MTPATILKQIYGDNTLVFGHRGALAYAPMNTIPSFELAAEQGAHGVELDVQFSKDRELVIVHDFAIDETTDGSGQVADLTLAELKELDAGSWFDPKFAGAKIPTLGEVFEAVGDKLIINVEIKHFDAEDIGLEAAVADAIEQYNMTERVIVSSFNPLVLKRFRLISPIIPLGYLQSLETMAGRTQPLINPTEYEARHLHYEMINDAQLNWSRESKHLVNTWTVNDANRARQLKLLGVRGIITDTPDVILQAIK